MKKIKTGLIFLCTIAICGSLVQCKKFLQQDPISTVAPDKFWNDQNDASTWLAGIYNQLQSTLNSNFFDWGEVRSDNMTVGGTGNAQQTMISNTLSANDADINGITTWTNLYTTISLCNYGIKYYPKMIATNADAGAAIYKDYLGQCYGLRALLYFYGLRVWGKLPIITTPVESLSQETQTARSSVDDVRKLILSDIDSSLQLIGSVTAQKFYIQKAAVYALQTDVAMWFQDYDLALAASDACLKASGCTPVATISDWKNIFTNPVASTESIFNIYWSVTERGTGCAICSKIGTSSNTNQYKPRVAIWQQLKDRVDPLTGKTSDGRYWALFDTLTYNSQDIYNSSVVQTGKFFPWKTGVAIGTGFTFQGNSDCAALVPVYRYADIILLRAEALTHKGRYQEALDIVNNIRKRVGYNVKAQLADYTGDITKGVERTVLNERQLELLGEGKRWFDLCRIDKIYDYSDNGYEYLRTTMNPILTATKGGIPFSGANMGRILDPINSAAFNANRKLQGDQNPPYDE